MSSGPNGLMENVLHAEFLDDLFARSALKQYTRTLLFSDVFIAMGDGVTGAVKSVHEAFWPEPITASKRCVVHVARRFQGKR